MKSLLSDEKKEMKVRKRFNIYISDPLVRELLAKHQSNGLNVSRWFEKHFLESFAGDDVESFVKVLKQQITVLFDAKECEIARIEEKHNFDVLEIQRKIARFRELQKSEEKTKEANK